MTSTSPIQGLNAAVDVSTYNTNHVAQPEYRELIKAVEAVNESQSGNLNNGASRFKLRIEQHRMPVIDVMDKDGQTVLYQIPPQRFLDYAKGLEDGRANDAAAVYVPSGVE